MRLAAGERRNQILLTVIQLRSDGLRNALSQSGVNFQNVYATPVTLQDVDSNNVSSDADIADTTDTQDDGQDAAHNVIRMVQYSPVSPHLTTHVHNIAHTYATFSGFPNDSLLNIDAVIYFCFHVVE